MLRDLTCHLIGGPLLSHSPHPIGEVTDALDDGAGFDSVLQVVSDLLLAPPIGLLNGPPHGAGDLIGVHDHLPMHVPRRPAHGLDQSRLRAQKALLIRIEDGHQ